MTSQLLNTYTRTLFTVTNLSVTSCKGIPTIGSLSGTRCGGTPNCRNSSNVAFSDTLPVFATYYINIQNPMPPPTEDGRW